MANYGFDLDGTITAAPDTFRDMMSALVAAGHNAYIVTAVMAPNTPELQQQKIDNLGFVKGRDYTDAVIIEAGGGSPEDIAQAGLAKRDACKRLTIEWFIDDRAEWGHPISEACPFALFIVHE